MISNEALIYDGCPDVFKDRADTNRIIYISFPQTTYQTICQFEQNWYSHEHGCFNMCKKCKPSPVAKENLDK
jgi:hypothetical protein